MSELGIRQGQEIENLDLRPPLGLAANGPCEMGINESLQVLILGQSDEVGDPLLLAVLVDLDWHPCFFLQSKQFHFIADQKVGGNRRASLSRVVTDALGDYFKGKDM